MNESFFLWITVLVLILGSVSGLMFMAGFYWHKIRHDGCRGEDENAEQGFNSAYVEQQIATFDQSLEGIEASLDSLNNAMSQMDKRQNQDDTDPVVREQAYRIAQRMAAAGASRMELIKTCGITPGEATLIRRLQHEKTG